MNKIKSRVYKIIIFCFLSFLLFANQITLVSAETTECKSGQLCNPLGEIDTPQELISNVIKGVLGVVGSIALIMFVYGGFTWMMASGNQEAIKKGREILVWATIGLIIIFSAYAITNFIFTGIGAF